MKKSLGADIWWKEEKGALESSITLWAVSVSTASKDAVEEGKKLSQDYLWNWRRGSEGSGVGQKPATDFEEEAASSGWGLHASCLALGQFHRRRRVLERDQTGGESPPEAQLGQPT